MKSNSCRVLLAFFAASAVGGWSVAAKADRLFVGGQELFEQCRSADLFSSGLCGGFIVGVYDGHVAQAVLKPSRGLDICIPKDATPYLLNLTVVQYLESRADLRRLPAAIAVLQALAANFPCNK